MFKSYNIRFPAFQEMQNRKEFKCSFSSRCACMLYASHGVYEASTDKKYIVDKSTILPNTKQIVKPFIFKKNKSPINTISYISNDSGKMRHFTPAAQE